MKSKPDPTQPTAETRVDQLLELAGRRPSAPPETRAEVQAAVREVWRAKVQSQARLQRARRNQYLTLAALLVLVTGIAFWAWMQTPASIAVVESAQPGAVWWKVEEAARPLLPGNSLPTNSFIETNERNRAALRLASGPSIRLDLSSRLHLKSVNDLFLERGAIYIDTGSFDHKTSFTVLSLETPFGTARNLGTQFEVRLLEEAVRINIREGRVEFSTGPSTHLAGAGSSLLGKADGSVELSPIEPYGGPWDWILRTTPAFILQDRPLDEILAWVSRETGWTVTYEEPQLERDVATIKVLSAISDLRPDQAPAVVLPSSGLTYKLENGVLIIRRAKP